MVRREALLCGQAQDPLCTEPIADTMVAMALGRPYPQISTTKITHADSLCACVDRPELEKVVPRRGRETLVIIFNNK